MKAYALSALVAASVAGCSGLDITPISPEADRAAHAGTPLQGYIVYAPMVVVEVARKVVCNRAKADGQCEGTPAITCAAGTPFTLPDPPKPFLVNSRSGFGKAGVDVTITNGWQLGGIKDTSDNTAILGLVEKLLPLKSMTAATAQASEECKAGLYRVSYDGADLKLEELLLY